MGIAASASSPPPEAAAPAAPPPKEDTQRAAAAAAVAVAPQEAAAPADPPPKEETLPTAAAAAAAADAPGGDAEETVVLDAAAEAGEKGEEEEGECGFCLFMKGGGCKEEFVRWEKCVEEAEVAGGDVVERCYEATAALRKCMDAHAEYYEPILRTERAMAEDLEAAMASEASETSPTSPAAAEVQGDCKKQAEEEVVVKEKEKGDLAV